MNRIFTKYYAGKTVLFEPIDVQFRGPKTPPPPVEDIFPPEQTAPPEFEDIPVNEYARVIEEELQPVYSWNTEKDKILYLTIPVTVGTQYLKYFFPNQKSNNSSGFTRAILAEGQGQVIIGLQNPERIGNVELGLVAGDNNLGDGPLTTLVINVSQDLYYGTPDIRNIVYSKIINEADLRPLDFKFDFFFDVVNSAGIEIFLGSDTTTPIKTIPVAGASAEVEFYAKDLHQSYAQRFGETDDFYNLVWSFRPYFNSIAGKEYGKLEVVSIKVRKTKFTLSKEQVVNKISDAFSKLLIDTEKGISNKITFEDEKHLYYRVKLDTPQNQSIVVTNIAEDDVTYSKDNSDKTVRTDYFFDNTTGQIERVQDKKYGSLVIKLLEPIPITIEENTQLWIAKQILPSVIEDIILTGVDTDSCITLVPNFQIDTVDELGYEYYNSIISSGSTTSEALVSKYLRKNEFSLEELNIQYTSGSNPLSENFLQFGNFVNFSSAKTRLDNYQFKLESIEFWDGKATTLNVSTSSLSLATSRSYSDSSKNIIKGFDAFEKTLYNNFSITASNDTFFLAQSDSAEQFDGNNKNYLVNHLPKYLTEGDGQSASPEYILFVEMISQHFDVMWSYINGLRRIRDIQNKNTEGINDKLLYSLLEHLGWDSKNPFSSQQLWLYAFGVTEDNIQKTNKNLLGETIVPTYTPEDAKKQVWRRIVNNLPYLLKYKGTRRSIYALMSCYGIPSSLLSIMEFGGPSNVSDSYYNFTYEDRTGALNLENNEYITAPWKDGVQSTQVRFSTKASQFTQTVLRGEANNGYTWNVKLKPEYKASFGTVRFELSGSVRTYSSTSSYTTSNVTASIELTGSVLYDGFYKNITVQKKKMVSGSYPSYDRYELYVQEGLDDRIIMSQYGYVETPTLGTPISGGIYWETSGWEDSGSIYVGSDTYVNVGMSGSIDDFRLWNTPLSQSAINAHTLNSDVIWGNTISSSTDDLLLRLDFEYAKNRKSGSGDPYIRNVAPGVTFTDSLDNNGKAVISAGYAGWATASIYTSASIYPYQYSVYTRNVTATYPSVGFVPSDKTRFEDIELVTSLSYRQRATKKSLDRTAPDSNKLGIFFSPIKDLNLNILQSLGVINLGNYIGDWSEEYGVDSYEKLETLRHYYFKRIKLNINEYVNLIRSIDYSFYDMLEQLVPARANLITGLLFEPSFLERNKNRVNRPEGLQLHYSSSTEAVNLEVESSEHFIDSPAQVVLPTFDSGKELLQATIDTEEEFFPLADYILYTASIQTETNETLLFGDLDLYQSQIDTQLRKETVLKQHEQEKSYESAGNDKDSPYNSGFGIVGNAGAVDRTYFRSDGSLVLTERNNAYILTIKYTREVPSEDIDGNITDESVPKYVKRLVLISQFDKNAGNAYRTPTAHSFYTNILANLGSFPYDNGVITNIEVFDGYTDGHFRYRAITSSGLRKSFYEGSRQTADTTTDGAPAWEIFATNPNKLKVNDTRRGSGEPILETT